MSPLPLLMPRRVALRSAALLFPSEKRSVPAGYLQVGKARQASLLLNRGGWARTRWAGYVRGRVTGRQDVFCTQVWGHACGAVRGRDGFSERHGGRVGYGLGGCGGTILRGWAIGGAGCMGNCACRLVEEDGNG